VELKLPMVVVSVTDEPSGGIWPVSARRTSTVIVLEPVPSEVMSDGLAVTETLSVVTGVGGLGVWVLPPGSVGEDVQPRTAARTDAAIKSVAFRKSFILRLLHSSRRDFDRELGRLGGDLVARARPAEETHAALQRDDGGAGLGVAAEIEQILQRHAEDLVVGDVRHVAQQERR